MIANSIKEFPSPDGLEEPFRTEYIMFSRQVLENNLNQKQLYLMHARKKSKLLDLQRKKRNSNRLIIKKDKKGKSRSLFASTRPRDNKGRFFPKETSEFAICHRSKLQENSLKTETKNKYEPSNSSSISNTESRENLTVTIPFHFDQLMEPVKEEFEEDYDCPPLAMARFDSNYSPSSLEKKNRWSFSTDFSDLDFINI